MPSLVRASLTSLAPVRVATVSERDRRLLASSISSAHSSADSRSPKTTTRGWLIAISTSTSRSPAGTRGRSTLMWRPGSGLAGAAAATLAAAFSPSAAARAVRATPSSQPLTRIASTTTSGEWPAAAWAAIHSRNSGVTTCMFIAYTILPGAGPLAPACGGHRS